MDPFWTDRLTRLADTFFNVAIMAEYAPKIADGFFVTVWLALAVVVTGIVAGLMLAVIRSVRLRLLNFFIVVFVDVMRAVPPLVIIIILYFALPTIGVRLSGVVSTWLALSMVLAAFAEEIFWAGILAVPKGQAGRQPGHAGRRTNRQAAPASGRPNSILGAGDWIRSP